MASIRIDFETPLTSEIHHIMNFLESLQNKFQITILEEKKVNKLPSKIVFENDERSTFPPLPNTLKEVHFKFCPNVTNLPSFPNTLEKIVIMECPNVKEIPKVPNSVMHFEVHDTPLTYIPCENDTLYAKHLYLSNTDIQVLPALNSYGSNIEFENNPFHEYYKSYVGKDIQDIVDFFDDYTKISKAVREALQEGISFDIVKAKMKEIYSIKASGKELYEKCKKVLHKDF